VAKPGSERAEATCLTKQKMYVEAEPVLLRALGLRTKAFGETHARTQRTIEDLGDLYEQWGKPAQAKAYRARLVPAETKVGSQGTSAHVEAPLTGSLP